MGMCRAAHWERQRIQIRLAGIKTPLTAATFAPIIRDPHWGQRGHRRQPMVWRKWIVRGIVWGIFSAVGLGAVAYQRWTNPGAVREQVIAEIGKTFPGAHVSVDSARLRILGGIQPNGLRLTRADDSEKSEFLHVPSAIFYHDKEKILDGELRLRKIELIRPRLRLRRERDGSWNLKDLLRKPSDGPMTPVPAI